MAKQYIGSQEHWEDSINADYDKGDQEKQMEQSQQQPEPEPEKP